MPNAIRELLNDRLPEGEAITWDDCDAAIIGVVERCGSPPLVCYDYDLLVQCFVDEDTDWEGAVEWVDFNIVAAYVGPGTPMILYRPVADNEA